MIIKWFLFFIFCCPKTKMKKYIKKPGGMKNPTLMEYVKKMQSHLLAFVSQASNECIRDHGRYLFCFFNGLRPREPRLLAGQSRFAYFKQTRNTSGSKTFSDTLQEPAHQPENQPLCPPTNSQSFFATSLLPNR